MEVGTLPLTGGRLVVDSLRALGVRLVCGVPGGQTLAITDALLDCPEIRFVATRHENAAACAADAVGRLTGQPGVCLATTGPGATNLLTGVGGAFRDSSPMIVLTCNNNLRDIYRDDAQAADHVSIFRPLTKRAVFVADASVIPQTLEEAYILATTGRPGPVLVDFARNVLESPVAAEHIRDPRLDPSLVMPPRVAPDPSLVHRAATELVGSSHPIIWVGSGVARSGASKAVLGLAERLDAPVITTFNAIGAVPGRHRLAFGPKSRMGTALSTAVIEGADMLLAVGNSLNAISTNRWSMPLPDRIIQVDSDPAQVGRYYAPRTLALVGDARTAIEALIAAVDQQGLQDTPSRERRERLAALVALRDAWRSRVAAFKSGPDSIAPVRLVEILREASPDDTVLVVDAGNPGVWTHVWEARESGEYLKPVGFGNMGFGLGAAIGAKLARPSAPVTAVIGDGSMAMTIGDLETLVREDLGVVVVVMNDSGYGNIRQEQLMKYGDRTTGVDFRDVDFAAAARAFGVPACTVTTDETLLRAFETGFQSGAPYLIDARIDRDVSVWTFPPFIEHDPED